ncbi:hypothetical protein JKY72_01825 [Candidatus Gracilibacteria bacterium]|nr:hypothetical protein [Candidatus Gracilibacteria bacterium]
MAPAYNMAANTINKVEVRLVGQVISEISRDFGDVDTMRKRLTDKKDILTGFESEMNWMHPHYARRLNRACKSGDLSQRCNKPFLAPNNIELNIPSTMTWSHTNDVVSFWSLAGFDLTTVFQIGDYFVAIDDSLTSIRSDLQANCVTAVTWDGANTGTLTVKSNLIHRARDNETLTGHYFVRKRYKNTDSQQAREFITYLKPSMGAFEADNLPAGEWQIDIQPRDDLDWRHAAIRSLLSSNLVHGKDFHISMMRTEINYSTYPITRASDGLLPFAFNECAVSKQNITHQDQWLQFQINKDATACAFGVQDTRVRTDTRLNYSLLRAYNDDFTVRQEQLIKTWDVYVDTRHYPTERPWRISNARPGNYHFGGTSEHTAYEGFDTWLTNGPYVYLDLAEINNSQEHVLKLKLMFEANPVNSRAVLFTLFKRNFEFIMRNGQVCQVRKVDGPMSDT